MAAAASRSSARQNLPKIADNDFLAIEKDSASNSKVRPKTLKEKAALIASKIVASGKSCDTNAKGAKVTKDAVNPDDQSGGSQVSRVTRQQTLQNGGAHSGDSESQSGSEEIDNSCVQRVESVHNPALEIEEVNTPVDSSPEVESEEVIPALRVETTADNSENELPAKKAKMGREPQDKGKADFDISQALLGAIQNLNSNLNKNTSGIEE